MLSADGHFVICFNGEVFNYRDLRSSLEVNGHHFRGHSDTEVLLAARLLRRLDSRNTLRRAKPPKGGDARQQD